MTDERKAPEIEEADFITLEFDDGVEVECEIMGVFDYDGKEYIALIPNDDTDDVPPFMAGDQFFRQSIRLTGSGSVADGNQLDVVPFNQF